MHYDRFGVALSEGDLVVTAKYDGLALCKISRFTEKMVQLKMLNNDSHWSVLAEFARYSKDILKVDQKQALMFLLKKDIK